MTREKIFPFFQDSLYPPTSNFSLIFPPTAKFFAFGFLKNEPWQAHLFLSYIFLAAQGGHVCVEVTEKFFFPPLELLLEKTVLEQIDKNFFHKSLLEGSLMIPEDVCDKVMENSVSLKKPIVKWNDYYYLQRNFVLESEIFSHLLRLARSNPSAICEKNIYLENIANMSLTDCQKNALYSIFEKALSIFMGGPGTGKTYTAFCFTKALIHAFKRESKPAISFLFLSPTGKAAAHLKEIMSSLFALSFVKMEFMTLHSALEIFPDREVALGKKQLLADVIIVDESSMIDLRMMAALLNAVDSTSRILFLGDPQQLPPIDAGNIFTDLIKVQSLKNHIHFLKEAKRFDNEGIYSFARMANEQKREQIISFLQNPPKGISFFDSEKCNLWQMLKEKGKEYFFIGSQDILDLVSFFSKSRFLCSLKKGESGSDILNQKIFSFLSPLYKGEPFMPCPIIFTKTNSSLGIYNGQMGLLYQNRKKVGEDTIFVMDTANKNFFSFPAGATPFYELAYCLSVHKSQGCEFDHVFYIIPEGSESFGKELIYTGASRAKKTLEIFSNEKILSEVLENVGQKMSGLQYRKGPEQ